MRRTLLSHISPLLLGSGVALGLTITAGADCRVPKQYPYDGGVP